VVLLDLTSKPLSKPCWGSRPPPLLHLVRFNTFVSCCFFTVRDALLPGVLFVWCSVPEFRGGSLVFCPSPVVLHRVGGFGCFWFHAPPPPPFRWWSILVLCYRFCCFFFNVMFVVTCLCAVCSQRSVVAFGFVKPERVWLY
jgi:hypothetical protein